MKALAALLFLTALARAEPVREAAFLGQLVAAKTSALPGETIDLALHIKHDPGFHTYWKAPGIVGVPTAIDWVAKSGLNPGDILWPQPQRVKMGPYWAYGYEDECYLVIPVAVPDDAEPGTVAKLDAKISFMVCPAVVTANAGCHPGFIDLSIKLPIAEKAGAETEWAEGIAAARASLPIENTAWEASARREGDKITLILAPGPGPRPAMPKRLHFYSADGQTHSDAEQVLEKDASGTITIRLERSEFAPKEATSLSGILFTDTGLPDGTGAVPVFIDAPYQDS